MIEKVYSFTITDRLGLTDSDLLWRAREIALNEQDIHFYRFKAVAFDGGVRIKDEIEWQYAFTVYGICTFPKPNPWEGVKIPWESENQ